jgi:DNA-binding transcriptional regulator YhcF (GntR family)
MDFVLKRKGGVPLHDQLLAQLELRILTGVLQPGQRLPSVRALARRLGLHANTVSSAYRALEAAGHVELRRGAGVYVRSGSPAALEDARGLDELIRLALSAAFRKGHSGGEIRAAVERWLRAAPPERVVVVDPRRETLDLVTHEIRDGIGVPAAGCTLAELEREPGLAAGALLVALPYHSAKVARAAPGVPVETIRVSASDENEKAVLGLPAGSTVLLVSGSPIVLQIAQGLISGLRGDELLIEGRLVSRRAEWRRLVPAADIVFADALAAPAVREARPRRLREMRLVGEHDMARVRKALGRAESAA